MVPAETAQHPSSEPTPSTLLQPESDDSYTAPSTDTTTRATEFDNSCDQAVERLAATQQATLDQTSQIAADLGGAFDALAAADAAANTGLPTVEDLAADDLAGIDRLEQQQHDYIDRLVAEAEVDGEVGAVAVLESARTQMVTEAHLARRRAHERALDARSAAAATAASRQPNSDQIAAILEMETAYALLRRPYESLVAAVEAANQECLGSDATYLVPGLETFIADYRAWIVEGVAGCIELEATVFTLLGRSCPIGDLLLASLRGP